MDMKHQTLPLGPAADAAALLRRLGFAILVMFLPGVTFFSRRAAIIMAPIGVALLIIASFIETPPRGMARALGAFSKSSTGVAGLLFLLWAALSILWSPDRGEAEDKLFDILQAVILSSFAIISLPARVRASNLYLTSNGVVLAVIAVAILITMRSRDLLLETAVFERGLMNLALIAWPAVAWLDSRDRWRSSLALIGATAGALLLARCWIPLSGFAVAGIIYGITAWRPQFGNRLVAWGAAGMLLSVPFLAVFLSPLITWFSKEGGILREGIGAWQTLVIGKPLNFLMGYGLDTVLPARLSGALPQAAPQGLLFEIWFELGAVGALLGAIALYSLVRRVEDIATGPMGSSYLVPGLTATMAAAFALSVLGAGTAFPWWSATLAVVAVSCTAITRGQFRKHRPKALGIREKLGNKQNNLM